MMAVTRLAPVASLVAAFCVLGTHAQFMLLGGAAINPALKKAGDGAGINAALKKAGDDFVEPIAQDNQMVFTRAAAHPDLPEQLNGYLPDLVVPADHRPNIDLKPFFSIGGSFDRVARPAALKVIGEYKWDHNGFSWGPIVQKFLNFILKERDLEQESIGNPGDIQWTVCNDTFVRVIYPKETGLTFTYSEAKVACGKKKLSLPPLRNMACVAEFLHSIGGGTGWFGSTTADAEHAVMFDASVPIKTHTVSIGSRGLHRVILQDGWAFKSVDQRMNTLVCVKYFL